MNDVKTKHIGTTKGSEEFRHSSQGFFSGGSSDGRASRAVKSIHKVAGSTPARQVPFSKNYDSPVMMWYQSI